LIKESDDIIRTLGSREVALGIHSGDSDSVEKASGSSTSSSAGGSPTGTVDYRKAKPEPEPTGTTDFSSTMKVVKKKEKTNQKQGSFVPQFMELINKAETEVKYDTSLDELRQSLTQGDKKLQADLESLRIEYERQRQQIETIISARGS